MHIKNEQTNKNIEELILSKFGEKSEIIDFDNMNKIKTILSNNKVIKEEIFYPNEIYKWFLDYFEFIFSINFWL